MSSHDYVHLHQHLTFTVLMSPALKLQRKSHMCQLPTLNALTSTHTSLNRQRRLGLGQSLYSCLRMAAMPLSDQSN